LLIKSLFAVCLYILKFINFSVKSFILFCRNFIFKLYFIIKIFNFFFKIIFYYFYKLGSKLLIVKNIIKVIYMKIFFIFLFPVLISISGKRCKYTLRFGNNFFFIFFFWLIIYFVYSSWMYDLSWPIKLLYCVFLFFVNCFFNFKIFPVKKKYFTKKNDLD